MVRYRASGDAALVFLLRMRHSHRFPLPVSKRAGVLYMNTWLPLLGYQQEENPLQWLRHSVCCQSVLEMGSSSDTYFLYDPGHCLSQPQNPHVYKGEVVRVSQSYTLRWGWKSKALDLRSPHRESAHQMTTI